MSLNARQNLKYAGLKFIELIATLFVVSFLTFAAFSIIPGDTAQIMLGPNASPEQVARLRTELGLDQPLPVRYIAWVAGAFTGNLGDSSSFKVPVISLIAQRLPVTLGMSILALIMVIAVSYPLSVFSARRPGRIGDTICSILGHVLFAIPPFVLSLLLIVLASGVLHIFTMGKYAPPEKGFGNYIASLALPAFAIALPKIAMTFKFMRSAIIEQNASEYVKTERSHGLSEARILLRHVLPNSNVSSITIITLVLSDILGGSLIVEQVFNLPGLGRLLLTAIDRRDFPLMSGMIFYLALITVILYFVSDILASIADPRIRLK